MFARAAFLRRSCRYLICAPVPQKSFFSLSARSASAVDAAMAQSASGVTVDGLKGKLMEQLQAQHVEIEDMSGGCGQSFHAIVVSPQFENMGTLARHRLVNSVVKTELAAIHAWTPKCYTPQQWQQLQERSA